MKCESANKKSWALCQMSCSCAQFAPQCIFVPGVPAGVYFRLCERSFKKIHPGAWACPEKFLTYDIGQALKMGRAKRIWYLSPMRAAKVQASLRIHTVSPEPPLLAHTSSESRGTFRQKARSLAPLNGWACAVKICHDGMLEDTNSLDGAQMMQV